MRQFNFFANGGPFPGTCLSCGNNKELYDLGKDQQTGSSYLLCTRCVAELATFTGYIQREPAMREHDHQKRHIAELQAQVDAIPTLVEGLINGIRSNVADFVLTVSSSGDSGSSAPLQDGAEPARKPSRARKTEDGDN